ncbi:hypothetical protein FPV67DRAFT_1465909 [Lyophyllum atratum]|nr:hypothetical protein FPV67DRAFT_1465909 [Lyophyllum atratum]
MSTGSPSPRLRSPSPSAHLDSTNNSLHPSVDDGDDISEEELRELYDNEEIERFLTLFSAYVTEVRAPQEPSNKASSSIPPDNSNDAAGVSTPLTDSAATTDSSDIYVTHQISNRSILEEIVYRWFIPILPPARLPPPPFTVGRLRLTTQRLYLAVQPVYIPFLSRMVNLATWNEKRISLLYCAIFWILWYHDLLLPCLLLRIFYSLVRRKIFPYPTLVELRNHRREISRAAEFGDQISDRLLASSSLGVKEMWRLFKVFNQTTKNKIKASAKATDILSGVDDEGTPTQPEEVTVLDDSRDSQETRDMKRLGLEVLDEIADLHERIKNIFIWRRPASSRVYGMTIFCLFLVTLLLPTKYLTKLTYFVGGVLFWHVTPVVAALPPAERSRLPPAFGDVPTDADYAMELLAKRVAAGLDINPPRAKKHGKRHTRTHTIDGRDSTAQRNNGGQPEPKSQSVDWKKWGERAAIGKTWADDGKRIISGRTSSTIVPPENPLIPQFAVDMAVPDQPGESHTYPAQHASGPGLLTLTGSTLLFTPLMSLEPKFVIPLSRMRGVKKAGLLKGLQIRAALEDRADTGEREEKFRWIGARDEVFARLVGTDGRRWIKA